MKKKYYHIVVRPDVKKALKTRAVEDDITLINLVEDILTEWLEKELVKE